MSKLKPKLMIIDGNALIHRSFHALPPTIQTKDGTPTNAVYGFTNVLFKAIRDLKPEYIALTLDKKGPTFRHKAYKGYKAKRIKAPNELYVQIPLVKEIAKAFNIPVFEKSGFEADDLIGTITKLVDDSIEKIIVTGDMDTLQLVNHHTKVFTMSRGIADSVIYDEAGVKEKYSLSPGQLIDYKALRGDPSDNIPGVKGIGEKTATELLKKFKTLDELYKALGKKSKSLSEIVSPRIIGLLEEKKSDAYMSQMLGKIKLDVPIKFDLEKVKFGGFKTEDVQKKLVEFEFKSLLPRIKELASKHSELKIEASDKFKRNIEDFNYVLVNDDKKFKIFLVKLKKQKEFTFDTETTGVDPISSGLLGISFSWEKGGAYYVKVKSEKQSLESENRNLFNFNEENGRKSQKDTHPWLERLKPFFEDEKIKKIAHNIKFDLRVMQSCGIEVKGLGFDTMLASYLLNPGSRQHGLDGLVFSELGFEKISKEDLLGKGRDKIEFRDVEVEKLSNYSCEDADFTFRLFKKLKLAIKDKKLDRLFYDLEMPLVEVLAEMENNGIALDAKFLEKLGKKVHRDIRALEKKIWKCSGADFNIASTKQLKEILFEKLEISTEGIKKTKTGFSTAADELEKLRDQHEIIPLIQEYRELTKLANTYIDTLPRLVNEKTGRVHTSFNQAVAATGRLSSTEPNLQNIPIRTELGREIRKAFVAPKGYKLLSLDYSQIELRVAAHMSGDSKMIKAFKDGIDIHTATAAEINQVKLEEVSEKMRREAKAINFGILYGQGPHGLARTADISYARARDFIDDYFKVYSQVKKYLNKTIEEAHEYGYVETIFGRRRNLPEINSSIAMVRKGAERMAINTPIQGTAADIMKKAIVNVYSMLAVEIGSLLSADDVKMLLTVHDELLFEVKEDKVDEVVPKLQKIMEDVIKLKVPVKVDAKVGDNWGELKSV